MDPALDQDHFASKSHWSIETYLLSDGQVWNAQKMSRFFPVDEGDDFLADWYSPDLDDMPVLQFPVPEGGGERLVPRPEI